MDALSWIVIAIGVFATAMMIYIVKSSNNQKLA